MGRGEPGEGELEWGWRGEPEGMEDPTGEWRAEPGWEAEERAELGEMEGE